VPKIKVEILIADDSETLVVNTILESASSGSIGDGKIWVTPVEDAVRIRTGERGNDAIDQEQGR
jgi:nitrogen regulatory protein P-II 1